MNLNEEHSYPNFIEFFLGLSLGYGKSDKINICSSRNCVLGLILNA